MPAAKPRPMRGLRIVLYISLLFAGLLFVVPRISTAQSILAQTRTAADRQIEIHYSLPSDSFVTIVIDNAEGRRVRNLIGAAPRKAGANVEVWDGMDDQGNAVPAAQYHWRILYHSGVNLEYLMSYGNPGTPPWATADGTGGWGADHTSPQAAVATPDGVVLGWPTAEAGWYLIGLGADGKKKWGLKNRYAFGDALISLATDGEYLYVASEQNAAPLMKYYKKMAHGVLYRYRLSDRKIAKFGGTEEVILTDQMDGNVKGIAVVGQTAYVALAKENKIAVVSLAEGKRLQLDDISISKPSALAVGRSGELLAVSGNQVFSINLSTRNSRSLIAERLDEPVALAVDASGRIYVADRGSTQQVKVFRASGKFVRSIGTPGGRPARGPHQTLGLYRPLGLAVDQQGLLWVTEEDDKPKRISVWNSETGAFVREYIGGPHYGALDGSVADFDKTMAFAEGIQYRLDWSKDTYTFVGTPGRAASSEDVFGRAGIRQVFRDRGRLFTASNTHVQVVGELKDGVLHPLAAVGAIDELTRRLGMFAGAMERKVEQLKLAGARLDANGNPLPPTAFIWTDRNGDGIAQDSEFVWKANLAWGGYWGTGIDSDFSVYMQSPGTVYRLPVTTWTSYGAPVYSFESATSIPYTGSAEHVAPSPDGMLIVNAKPQLLGISLADAQLRWSYPNLWEGVQGSHTADLPAPGRLIGPLSITGFAPMGGQIGTLFAMNGNLGQQFLMTSDGMWVGAVMRDWRLAKVEDMYTVPDEDFGGYFWKDQNSGEVYLEAGKTEYRLYRVTGLDKIRRADGQFVFGTESASAAALRSLERKQSRRDVPSVAIAKLNVPFPISGRLEDIPKAMRFTEVAADAGSKFRFALGHDQQNLYLAYDVTDDSPFENRGQEMKQIFATGDCVDLMYGVDAKADPRRKEGTTGDNRLLLTVMDGKPIAVLYRQVDPTHSWPVMFMSPSRAVYFGSVSVLTDVTVVVTRSKTGYVVAASVPLSTLGIDPKSATSFLVGDVGVIFGSASGNGARLRLYWANKATAITSDIPSEAALAPENWGIFRFEP